MGTSFSKILHDIFFGHDRPVDPEDPQDPADPEDPIDPTVTPEEQILKAYGFTDEDYKVVDIISNIYIGLSNNTFGPSFRRPNDKIYGMDQVYLTCTPRYVLIIPNVKTVYDKGDEPDIKRFTELAQEAYASKHRLAKTEPGKFITEAIKQLDLRDTPTYKAAIHSFYDKCRSTYKMFGHTRLSAVSDSIALLTQSNKQYSKIVAINLVKTHKGGIYKIHIEPHWAYTVYSRISRITIVVIINADKSLNIHGIWKQSALIENGQIKRNPFTADIEWGTPTKMSVSYKQDGNYFEFVPHVNTIFPKTLPIQTRVLMQSREAWVKPTHVVDFSISLD